jgi:UDP-N-acetylglucosamine kinase
VPDIRAAFTPAPSPLLPGVDRQRIFEQDIAPTLLGCRRNPSGPLAVVLVAQGGSGKTAIASEISDALKPHRGVVQIDTDLYRPFHPHAARLFRQDERTASTLTAPDCLAWYEMAVETTVRNDANALLHAIMLEPDDVLAPVRRFRSNGYRTVVAFVGIPEAHSRLGIVERYHLQRQAMGYGRLTPRQVHDRSFAGILRGAESVEQSSEVDEIAVLARNGEIVGFRGAGQSALDTGVSTRDAIQFERERQWSALEIVSFRSRHQRLVDEMEPQWRGELEEIFGLAAPKCIENGDAALHLAAPLDGRVQSIRELGMT